MIPIINRPFFAHKRNLGANLRYQAHTRAILLKRGVLSSAGGKHKRNPGANLRYETRAGVIPIKRRAQATKRTPAPFFVTRLTPPPFLLRGGCKAPGVTHQRNPGANPIKRRG